jgi:ubiquinone/menaquinone biosynthesis C-methylase UbiE
VNLEHRKVKEIEHSDRRRAIVRAHEYRTDASSDRAVADYVEGMAEWEHHFSNMKYYSISEASFARRDALLYEGIAGAVALDYCCGNGEIAIEMAKRGARRVVGIDISSVAVGNATALAAAAGVADNCEFRVMDAEHTEFAAESFDVIHEYGALHHLDLPAAFAELSRLLKPGGRVVCTEALRHNPLVHWYRKRTPHLRTEWEVEHILGIPEIERGLTHFRTADIRTFHLAVLAAVPFRKTGLFRPMLALLNRADDVLLRLPGLRRMAWVAVVKFEGPLTR